MQHSSAPSNAHASEELGDFTATPRMLWVAALAIPIGLLSSFVAVALLKLIALFTNLFYFQRWSTEAASPASNTLGYWSVLVPIVGALIIGLMARFGSERIRGHGIPEAIEAILLRGSRVEPRVAFLKPLSSAISIGSGGPFGAEGPIIMTGGAFGSLIAQFLHLSGSERKTLLVAGAAAGMAAVFASPMAAVLLAVEALLFEWKPRSFIPVALASVTAVSARRILLGVGPLFPTPPHPLFVSPWVLLGCIAVGLLIGIASGLLSRTVYACENLFAKSPIHWMWWPAIGGLVIGIGGLIFPGALGVGYDLIGGMLDQPVPWTVIFGILLVKSTIWAFSLGSGTSGGVLAPLLMIGGAVGAAASHVLPFEGVGFWPIVAMGAMLGCTMSAPFTGIVFMIEVTHDMNMVLPLMVTVATGYAFSVLTMRRSILTEKISRRGFHLSREYSLDPLEILFVRDVMRTHVAAIPENAQRGDLKVPLHADHHRGQTLYPVVNAELHLRAVATRSQLQAFFDRAMEGEPIGRLGHSDPVVAYEDEPLRTIVYRMADTGKTRLPVVERGYSRRLAGMISLNDLLRARTRDLEEERSRERVLHLRLPLRFRTREEAAR
ncbi:MAG: chloride channel protein [Acidobacteriota bacterium]